MDMRTKRDEAFDQSAEVAYEAMAPAYEEFTAHHDHQRWISMLLSLGKAHGLQGGLALDIGCGTGKTIVPLLDHGWQVTACDLSPSMVKLARTKIGPSVSIDVADVRDMPSFGAFQLVLCVDDVLNYLLSQAELERALTCIAANLAPDGLLLFDSNTLTTYRTFFSEQVEVLSHDRTLIWEGLSSGRVGSGDISEAAFRVEGHPSSNSSVIYAVHRQRHHPEDEVRTAISVAGLELLAIYGHRHDAIPEQPLDEQEHTKAIYISRLARRSSRTPPTC
jgi:SAM-dependent methyltransferase